MNFSPISRFFSQKVIFLFLLSFSNELFSQDYNGLIIMRSPEEFDRYTIDPESYQLYTQASKKIFSSTDEDSLRVGIKTFIELALNRNLSAAQFRLSKILRHVDSDISWFFLTQASKNFHPQARIERSFWKFFEASHKQLFVSHVSRPALLYQNPDNQTLELIMRNVEQGVEAQPFFIERVKAVFDDSLKNFVKQLGQNANGASFLYEEINEDMQNQISEDLVPLGNLHDGVSSRVHSSAPKEAVHSLIVDSDAQQRSGHSHKLKENHKKTAEVKKRKQNKKKKVFNSFDAHEKGALQVDYPLSDEVSFESQQRESSLSDALLINDMQFVIESLKRELENHFLSESELESLRGFLENNQDEEVSYLFGKIIFRKNPVQSIKYLQKAENSIEAQLMLQSARLLSKNEEEINKVTEFLKKFCLGDSPSSEVLSLARRFLNVLKENLNNSSTLSYGCALFLHNNQSLQEKRSNKIMEIKHLLLKAARQGNEDAQKDLVMITLGLKPKIVQFSFEECALYFKAVFEKSSMRERKMLLASLTSIFQKDQISIQKLIGFSKDMISCDPRASLAVLERLDDRLYQDGLKGHQRKNIIKNLEKAIISFETYHNASFHQTLSLLLAKRAQMGISWFEGDVTGLKFYNYVVNWAAQHGVTIEGMKEVGTLGYLDFLNTSGCASRIPILKEQLQVNEQSEPALQKEKSDDEYFDVLKKNIESGDLKGFPDLLKIIIERKEFEKLEDVLGILNGICIDSVRFATHKNTFEGCIDLLMNLLLNGYVYAGYLLGMYNIACWLDSQEKDFLVMARDVFLKTESMVLADAMHNNSDFSSRMVRFIYQQGFYEQLQSLSSKNVFIADLLATIHVDRYVYGLPFFDSLDQHAQIVENYLQGNLKNSKKNRASSDMKPVYKKFLFVCLKKYKELKQETEIKRVLDALMKIDSEDPQVHFDIGEYYLASQIDLSRSPKVTWELARKHLLKAHEMNHVDASCLLARIYFEGLKSDNFLIRKDPKKGLDFLSYHLKKNDPVAWGFYAEYLLANGEYSQAITCAQENVKDQKLSNIIQSRAYLEKYLKNQEWEDGHAAYHLFLTMLEEEPDPALYGYLAKLTFDGFGHDPEINKALDYFERYLDGVFSTEKFVLIDSERMNHLVKELAVMGVDNNPDLKIYRDYLCSYYSYMLYKRAYYQVHHSFKPYDNYSLDLLMNLKNLIVNPRQKIRILLMLAEGHLITALSLNEARKDANNFSPEAERYIIEWAKKATNQMIPAIRLSYVDKNSSHNFFPEAYEQFMRMLKKLSEECADIKKIYNIVAAVFNQATQ